jgi:UDP-N-acetyl-D-glucosamine/UDP-N-acetyl-D-galactosamine dehydrogenase
MGGFVAENVVKRMLAKGIQLLGSKVLMMGLSFKENCPDIRNTRATDIFAALRAYSIYVDIFDPWVIPMKHVMNTASYAEPRHPKLINMILSSRR